MSHPSMIAATLKLLLEVARRSAVSIVLGNLLDNLLGDLLSDLQSVDQTARTPESCCSTIPLLTLPG